MKKITIEYSPTDETWLVHSCYGAKEIEIAYWKYLTVPKEIWEKEIKSQTYVCKGVKE